MNAATARYVDQLIADAPPLTELQRARLLALLGPGVRALREQRTPRRALARTA